MKRRLAIAALGAALLATAAAARGENVPGRVIPANAPYKDPSLPFDKRVADLVSRMSLNEKAEQVQYLTRPNVELGISGFCWWTEAIHGISRAGTATVFPQAIGLAATWDPPLMQKIGDAIGDEARAKLDPNGSRYRGIVMWAPTINMARDPRWGRVEETYGEDPYLTGRISVGFIKGLQGDDPKYLKTIATPKHFAVHSQETGRMNRSFDVPDAVLHDYYLPAFRDSFVEGKAMSVMTAFSGFNKIPSTANFGLLTGLLRKDWSFEGAVVTDWGAVSQLVNGHRYVSNENEAIATALNAGVDVISDPRSEQMGARGGASGAGSAFTQLIVDTVKGGQLSEAVLTRAVSRNLMLRFRLGLFDPPSIVPFARIPASVVGSKDHIALALKAAQEGFVLLKNDPAPRGTGFGKLLPLDLRKLDSIAILGPNASTFYYGAYSGTPAGAAPKLVEAIKLSVGDRVTIRTDPASNAEDSIEAAARSDVVIFACGLNGDIEREGTDRSSIRLPDIQQSLLEKIVKANPNTIVVMQAGSPVGLAWMKEHVPAILLIWYPGEQGGNAAAQILLGQTNPSGRLPLTFYRNVTSGSDSDLPPLDDYDITKGRTYMYHEKPVPFVFGHGLSYTTFDYRNFQVTPACTPDGTITITLDIANTGTLDGDEVVQLYVHEKNAPTATAPGTKRPIKQLKAFQRLTIPKGQTRPVKLTIPAANLAFWDTPNKKFTVDPGIYEIMAGASSDDIRAKAEVIIK